MQHKFKCLHSLFLPLLLFPPPPSTLLSSLSPFPHFFPRWFPEVQNIFYQGNKRKQIPLGQLEAFFNATATLMTNLLQELALNSITDYLHVFCRTPVWHVLMGFSVGQERMMILTPRKKVASSSALVYDGLQMSVMYISYSRRANGQLSSGPFALREVPSFIFQH